MSKELERLALPVPKTSLVDSRRVGLVVENTAKSPNSFTSAIEDDFRDADEGKFMCLGLDSEGESLVEEVECTLIGDTGGWSSKEGIVRLLCTGEGLSGSFDAVRGLSGDRLRVLRGSPKSSTRPFCSH